jgi:protein tyrosine phosphatase
VQEVGGSTEAELCERAGLDYYRIPITDHVRPLEDDVDELTRLVRSLPPETWIHVHCRKGIDRTGTILTALAMLRDPHAAATAGEVATRCGNSHLFESADLEPHKAYKLELRRDRAAFLERFQEYVRSGTEEPWSRWIRED